MKYFLFILSLMVTVTSQAEDSLKKKATEKMNDTRRGVQKAGRELKDKTCELMNGKMECALQKAKHTVQDVADKVEDALE
jgi:hypothetical protein